VPVPGERTYQERTHVTCRVYAIGVCCSVGEGSLLLIETTVFTNRVDELLGEEEYRLLQVELVQNPRAGAVIPGTGGLRKLRWGLKGRGKRGGARVIYYWIGHRETILLLYVFAKADQAKLTPELRKALRQVVEEELP